jgi:hypothetical protein
MRDRLGSEILELVKGKNSDEVVKGLSIFVTITKNRTRKGRQPCRRYLKIP